MIEFILYDKTVISNMLRKETDIMIVTAGSSYLDIDAYACCISLSDLINLTGQKAIAFSTANCNYSVCESIQAKIKIKKSIPSDYRDAKFIIVDVSDPNFIKDSIPLDQVAAVYDHHVGFEDYWKNRIGDNSHIEFVGAAATLIYREWQKHNLVEKMSTSTAELMVAAILDNTLNLTSSNTTDEDRQAFYKLCKHANIDVEWCNSYFSEVQCSIENDLRNAIFKDIKHMPDTSVLPSRVAQLSIWNAENLFDRLLEIRSWFSESPESWMINIIDIQNNCSFFVCDDKMVQKNLERIFDIVFSNGIAKTRRALLRKEIIKQVNSSD